MPSPKLNEMLAEYRKARDAATAFEVCEHLLTLEASDLDERDRSHPACPRVDAQRRPHPMDEIDCE